MINIQENVKNKQHELLSTLGLKNISALPKITKVTLNCGLGQIRQNKDLVEYAKDALSVIAGQKPAVRRSKKAIAGFKLRQNEEIGLVVTLRGQKMFDFLHRLINVSLPRIRDFRGLTRNSFDKQGNFSIGFRDQLPFAELSHQVSERPFGVSVTVSIANSDPEKSYKLMQVLGFPMKTE